MSRIRISIWEQGESGSERIASVISGVVWREEWARSAGARTGVYTYKAIERAFSPVLFRFDISWRVAPGWYGPRLRRSSFVLRDWN